MLVPPMSQHALGQTVQTSCPDYDGPRLGIRQTETNKREWTAEQQQQQVIILTHNFFFVGERCWYCSLVACHACSEGGLSERIFLRDLATGRQASRQRLLLAVRYTPRNAASHPAASSISFARSIVAPFQSSRLTRCTSDVMSGLIPSKPLKMMDSP